MAEQDQNDTPSRLLEMSVEFRNNLIAKNEFQNGDPYAFGHPNALSDGDDYGRGGLDETAGNCCDTNARNANLKWNTNNEVKSTVTSKFYNNNNPYNISNA